MEEINLQFGSEQQEAGFALESADDRQYGIAQLTPEEQAKVTEFVKQINITDNNAIISYGAPAQKKIADFSDNVLRSVRTKDAGEAGKLLTNLMVEIQNFDSDSEEKKGVMGFFGGVKKSIDKMNANYAKVEVNVDKISNALENHKRQLLKDVALYDSMFESNYNYFKELNMYIIAGQEKLKDINENILPALRAKAEASGDEVDAQRLNDMANAINRFEKKLHDLQLSRMISLQMAPQIRLIQNNDMQLVDKIQSSIVNAIPLWKNQIVIALGLSNASNALAAQKKVTETTNAMLRKNSEMLKQGSIEIAKESERGIIELETVQKTNNDLIETIKTVLDIQQKGAEERRAAEAQLVKIEDELKQALLSAKGLGKIADKSSN